MKQSLEQLKKKVSETLRVFKESLQDRLKRQVKSENISEIFSNKEAGQQSCNTSVDKQKESFEQFMENNMRSDVKKYSEQLDD